MRIFLTGGTGFIGSYVLKELLKTKHELSLLTRTNIRDKFKLNRNTKVINKNIQNVSIKDLKDIDVVINLSAAGVSPQMASWKQMLEVNVLGSLRLMQLSKKAFVKRFICAGTCLEYGFNNFNKIPVTSSLNPTTPYAASKVAGFQLLNSFAKAEEIEFFYGRIFSAYGEGQYYKNLWPSLRNAALNNDDFPIKSCMNIRDFIHVTEVAKHFCKAVVRNDIDSKMPKIVNIGTGKGLTIKEFAEREWKKLNSKGKIHCVNLESDSSLNNRFIADIEGLEI